SSRSRSSESEAERNRSGRQPRDLRQVAKAWIPSTTRSKRIEWKRSKECCAPGSSAYTTGLTDRTRSSWTKARLKSSPRSIQRDAAERRPGHLDASFVDAKTEGSRGQSCFPRPRSGCRRGARPLAVDRLGLGRAVALLVAAEGLRCDSHRGRSCRVAAR